jgi:glutathione S-transferase
MLTLYGHPFSSYTWKALIPPYANGTAFEFRLVGGASAEDDAFIASASPFGASDRD